MDEIVKFEINLNPGINKWRKWKILGNPFDDYSTPRDIFLSTLKNGVTKKEARRMMKNAGMSKEAIDVILGKLGFGDIAEVSINIQKKEVRLHRIVDVSGKGEGG